MGELCSFDAFLGKYNLDDPALKQLAAIVRGTDTSRLNLTPQLPCLYALSLGLSKLYADDYEMLRHGMVMYDALYTWCQYCKEETLFFGACSISKFTLPLPSDASQFHLAKPQGVRNHGYRTEAHSQGRHHRR
ncbi:chromate resistance protein [Klebsiella pneumoniae]|nr:chromate resistance protein [Proteus mirabilis]EKY0566968.1 chromate resistance protein [Klebsiella aerogenes]EKZ2513207.1 chromate resistance protein [Klebsiella pneumoniae]EKZ2513548.1 chromate resistance protein [Klebsiella pneumoniae]